NQVQYILYKRNSNIRKKSFLDNFIVYWVLFKIPYISKKGTTITNVMAACDFKMCFTLYG
ncbi:hypothetical protein S245_040593, partial [Arachis hypogaea]